MSLLTCDSLTKSHTCWCPGPLSQRLQTSPYFDPSSNKHAWGEYYCKKWSLKQLEPIFSFKLVNASSHPSFSKAFGTRTANTARSRSLAATRLWPSLVLRKLLRQCRFWKMSRREIQISRNLVQSQHILGVSYVIIPVPDACHHAIVKRQSVHCLVIKGSLRFIKSPKIHCCCCCCQDGHTTKTCPSSNNHGSVENGKQTIVLVWDPFSRSINQEKSLCVCVVYAINHFPRGF